MTEWFTVKQAAEILKCSDRYVRNMASSGKLKAKKEGNLWFIHTSLSRDTESSTESEGVPKETESELLKQLKSDNDYLRSKLDESQKALNETRERSDTIILSLTHQIEQLQLEAPKSSWFQKLFRRSSKQ